MNAIGLKVHDQDNVATIFCEGVTVGDQITVLDQAGSRQTLSAASAIPYGHKIAIAAIALGESIVKYGEGIGTASAPIAPGDYVHVHNLDSTRGRGDLNRKKEEA